MFKLIMFFVILGFLLILAFAIYKITKGVTKGPTKSEESFNIDAKINELERFIRDAENQAHAGMENAEAKLAEFKDKLKKAQFYKKTHNL